MYFAQPQETGFAASYKPRALLKRVIRRLQ